MSRSKNVSRNGRGRGRPCSRSAPAVLLSSNTPKKRKQWTDESMRSAIDAVKGGQKIWRAAKQYNVPRETLQDRINSRVIHGTNPGPKPYLSRVEETELAEFLVDTAKAGYGKSRKQVQMIATNVVHDKQRMSPSRRISNGWYYRFMQRQNHLTLRKGDPIANIRMDCMNEETMTDYFDKLKYVLQKNKLMDSPSQIYNVDETGMPLDHRPPKIVTKRGQKKVRSRTSGNKSQVTVIACVSATGHVIPPFVIFDAKGLNYEWTRGQVPGTRYGLSSTGWVDTELFKGWLNKHFLKHAVGSRPLLLVLDGHSTHYQPELIKYCLDNDVVLMCLPPHTTHESQPLDSSVFKPLKQNWQNACHRFVEKNPGRVITKYDFSPLLCEAWGNAMVPNNIISGFRRSGIFPFNPNALDYGANSSSNANVGCSSASNTSVRVEEFTSEQIERFERRFVNNYDIPDPEYVRWLKETHPTGAAQLSSPPLNAIQGDTTLAAMFSLSPEEELIGLEQSTAVEPCHVGELPTVPFDVATVVESCPIDESPTVQDEAFDIAATIEPYHVDASHATQDETTDTSDAREAPQSSLTISATGGSVPGVAPPDHEGELTYISKYLIQYVPTKPKKAPAARATGARILTSEECSKMIFEREEKKRKEREEKEQRKAAREQKKKERNEAAKLRAERSEKRKQEAAHKKEEAARKKEEAAKKKEEAARRREAVRSKGRNNEDQASTSISRKRRNNAASTVSNKRLRCIEDDNNSESSDEGSVSSVELLRPTRSGTRHNTVYDDTTTDDYDDNQCCVCFRTYEEDQIEETGFLWVRCVCGRWVHEDCYSEVVMDKNGRELICPYCVL